MRIRNINLTYIYKDMSKREREEDGPGGRRQLSEEVRQQREEIYGAPMDSDSDETVQARLASVSDDGTQIHDVPLDSLAVEGELLDGLYTRIFEEQLRDRIQAEEAAARYTVVAGYRAQARYTHFITWDGPPFSSDVPRNMVSRGILRYAVWCREQGEQTGHEHYHMMVELTEPMNAEELEEVLFGEQWRNGQRFNVYVQHINKNKYAARYYIMKGRSKEQLNETWYECGKWTEPGAKKATAVLKLS